MKYYATNCRGVLKTEKMLKELDEAIKLCDKKIMVGTKEKPLCILVSPSVYKKMKEQNFHNMNENYDLFYDEGNYYKVVVYETKNKK